MSLFIASLLILATASHECTDPYFDYTRIMHGDIDCNKVHEILTRWQAQYDENVKSIVRLHDRYVELERSFPELEREYQRVLDNDTKEQQLWDELGMVIREAQLLEQDWKASKRELESGEYCSKCKRTKREIEKDGHTNFYQHVKDVKGRIQSAPESLIREKEREFVAKLKQKRLKMREYDHKIGDLRDARYALAGTLEKNSMVSWKSWRKTTSRELR